MNDHARVLFFATLRDRAGVKETTLEFPHASNIAEIKALVLAKFPALLGNMDTLIVALNHNYAFDEDKVDDGAEIAFFPPVSGGVSELKNTPTIVAIVNHEIDVNAILAQITLPTTGGICTFTGTVRSVTRRKRQIETEKLEYEAYSIMAEEKMHQICDEIRSRWKKVEGIAIIQRVGTLMPGTISVLVACSASHRDEGIFQAARYGIDRVKEIVPVWKKEITRQGEEWVEGDYIPLRGE
jgi:molybdopterin converting factor subunit 1